MEEMKMKELRMEALKRAIKHKEETRQSTKRIVIECIKETDLKKIKGEK